MHRTLRRRAAEAGMSLQEYLLAELTEQARRPTLEEVLEEAGRQTGGRLSAERLAAPAVIDLEVASAWRRIARSGRLAEGRADQARAHLAAMPLARASHGRLMNRIWDFRDSLTPYDAAYVALAELLGTLLLTADAALARAPGIACEVEVLS